MRGSVSRGGEALVDAPRGWCRVRRRVQAEEEGVFEFIAVFCGGVFFGAAFYVMVAQHPAALEIGPSFAGRFFGPMYRRAAPLQVVLAAFGTLAGLGAWWRGSGLAWLVGALCVVCGVILCLDCFLFISVVLL